MEYFVLGEAKVLFGPDLDKKPNEIDGDDRGDSDDRDAQMIPTT